MLKYRNNTYNIHTDNSRHSKKKVQKKQISGKNGGKGSCLTHGVS